jgi:aldehyde dehydrogenase (NAD+)
LVTPESLAKVQAVLTGAPGEPLFQGSVPTGPEFDRGNWLAPAAWRIEDRQHPIARDELFAPVLAVLECDGLEEGVAIANDTPFGLSASLFTADLGAAFRYIREIEVGLVRVNGDTTGVDPHAPFGGMKGSSSGSREQGRAARDFYTETRTVQIHA